MPGIRLNRLYKSLCYTRCMDISDNLKGIHRIRRRSSLNTEFILEFLIRGILLGSEEGHLVRFVGNINCYNLIVIIEVLLFITDVLIVIVEILIIIVNVLIVITDILIVLVDILIIIFNVLVVAIDVLIVIVDILIAMADILIVIIDKIRSFGILRTAIAVYIVPCSSFTELSIVIIFAHQLIEVAPA